MADPTYLDYEEDPDLNGVGQPSKTRFAEGWKGYLVNDAMRWMAAVIRRLGDRSLFAPDAEGVPAAQVAGSMAMQNADAVAITGGTVAAFGYAPVLTVLQVYTTWTTFLSIYEGQYRAYGWLLCDGRTDTNPFTGVAFTTPNLFGRYLMCLDDTSVVGLGGGSFGSTSKTTEAAGTHSHAGSTGLTALTTAQLPPHDHANGNFNRLLRVTGGGTATATDAGSDVAINEAGGIIASVGSGQGHAHGIGSDGSHQHTITDIRPLTAMVIPVIRAW